MASEQGRQTTDRYRISTNQLTKYITIRPERYPIMNRILISTIFFPEKLFNL